MQRLIFSSLSFAAVIYACQREWYEPVGQTHFHKRHEKRQEAAFPPVLTEQETIIVNSFDNNTIEDWSYYYTHEQKLAGLGKAAAQWTVEKWREYGFNADLAEYYAYLSYPKEASLHVTYGNGTEKEVNLKEPKLAADDVTNRDDNQPTFHGYSASGDVEAEYVYVGRGQQVDFARLKALNVSLAGKIALAKYGGPFRGLKVKNAQENGMIGVVIFTDTDGDGNVTVAKGVAAYPDGPARHPDAVQKGSVLFLSTNPGDPTTPGYPSKKDSPRADPQHVTPRIPSIPISYAAAQPLLQALDGHGTPGRVVNRTAWVGALNATYSTGPAPGVKLRLHNKVEPTITPVWNAIGYINGTNSDETIVIGNHRDTWMIGGAGDPNSGSAILIELAKAIKRLTDSGWKPTRNIVLASWDAEEWGMIGSVEWIEEHVNWLTETAVAYLNIDVAVSGPVPDFSATPELNTVANELLKKIIHPSGGSFNETLYDKWYDVSEGELGVLGSGSDYTGFVHKGISSIDVGSSGGPGDPIWHYHSNYDTFHWMATFGDPGFYIHRTMGQFLTLLAYHLATDELLPFDLPNYATALRTYYKTLETTISSTNSSIDILELDEAIKTFTTRANEVKALADLAKLNKDPALIKVVNHKFRDFQRGFVSQGGLPGREFYRHVVNAPGIDTGYAPVTYPGITEALQAGNLERARDWVRKTARGIVRASEIIKT